MQLKYNSKSTNQALQQAICGAIGPHAPYLHDSVTGTAVIPSLVLIIVQPGHTTNEWNVKI